MKHQYILNENMYLLIKKNALKVLYMKKQIQDLIILYNYFIMREIMMMLKDMDIYI